MDKWTTVELLDFLNSYKHIKETIEINKLEALYNLCHKELSKRHPLIAILYG